jgi:hypothetical protein
MQDITHDAHHRLKAPQIPGGCLTTYIVGVEQRASPGVDFLLVSTDGALLSRVATSLLHRLRENLTGGSSLFVARLVRRR